MKFYLGTHKACWLARTDVPLFVSRRTLCGMKTLPRAKGLWALDSGAFTELKDNGKWTVSPWDYIREVRRFREEIGGMEFAVVQDWMCEPFMLKRVAYQEKIIKPDLAELVKRFPMPNGSAVSIRKLSTEDVLSACPDLTPEQQRVQIRQHQTRSTQSYIALKSLAPEVPWVPVLQGWEFDDYLWHLEQYRRAVPFSLAYFRHVGLGSVCRRQNTDMAEELVRELHGMGLKVHAFGFKLQGLERAGRYLASADSMAWSYDARNSDPLPGCTHSSCANCMTYALAWREKALKAVRRSEADEQRTLFSLPMAGGKA